MSRYKHGLSDTPIYHKWENVKQRCNNPNHPSYPNYGGRGILMCGDWDNFEVFYTWAINNGYSDSLELDRINNDGNYEPTNCRFITHKENNYNKRTNVLYDYKGESLSIEELSLKYHINPQTLRTRLFKGWSVTKSIEYPIRKAGRYNEEYYR